MLNLPCESFLIPTHQTKTHQQNGIHGNLLCMPALIRRRETIAARQERPDDMRQVIPRHLRRAIILRSESQQTPAENPADQRPQHDVESASIVLRRTPSGQQDADDGDGTAGDLQEGSFVARETEAFDED